MPLMASDGIQETEVTDDSMRMGSLLPRGPPRSATTLRRHGIPPKGVTRHPGRGQPPPVVWWQPPLTFRLARGQMAPVLDGRISVFLADDNLIVREGVRALLNLESDFEVVGVAGDYDELVSGAEAAAPQVIVTDIRMPPAFPREGIDAANELRKRHPGTGVVILSQYDDPEYAISLLSEGSEGRAYLLKDRVAEGDQLARAVRAVATGGSMLDPKIVEALVNPVAETGGLSKADEELIRLVAEGRTIKAIAAAQRTTAAAVSDAVEELFLKLAKEASAGAARSCSSWATPSWPCSGRQSFRKTTPTAPCARPSPCTPPSER